MVVNISAEEIFCVLVKDFFRLVQTFCFKEMSSALKMCFIIIDDCINLFSANLNVYVFYNEEKKAHSLPTFPNCTTLTFSTLEFNDHMCNEFLVIEAENEAAYLIAVEVEKR